jgi:hypothetical protein
MAQRLRIFSVLLFVLFLTALLAATAAETGGTRDPRPTPMMSSVEPASGRSGDVLKVSGIYLDASFVRELYVTAGGVDVKAEIVEQSATVIRFKIPAEAKPGRHCLTVLTTEEPPTLLEQPAASLTVTETR